MLNTTKMRSDRKLNKDTETEAGHCVGIIYGSGVGDWVTAGWLVASRKYNELYLW